MKHRSNFFSIYHMFCAFAKTQDNVVINFFRYDIGDEYTTINFFELHSSDGTVY